MSAGAATLTFLLLISASPAAAQQLARLVDTNPTGNGNAWVKHQAPTRAWLTGGGSLWRSDGTTAGTQPFVAIAGLEIHELVEIGDRVYFTSSLLTNGLRQGLTVLDTAGVATQLLPGVVAYLHELHGELLFHRTVVTGWWPNTTFQTDTWLTDGTTAGTRPAPHIPVDTSRSYHPWRLHGDQLITVDGVWASTLYVTDGQRTTALTTTPRNSGPGFESSAHSTGHVLYFVKRVPVPGGSIGQVDRELWRTDGTVTGTVRVYDPAQPGFPPLWVLLGCIGDQAYFAGGLSLRELWRSDGTPVGTTFVTTLPGTPGLGSFPPVAVAGGIYFPAADPAIGVEPMFTDGTAAGSVFLGDLTPGPSSSGEFQGTPVGGNAALLRGMFAGRYSLWLSAGTAASTSMLLDLGTVLAPNPTWPHALTRGRYVLVGTDAAGDREIWSVDGLAVAQAIGEGAPPATAPRLGATRPVVGTTATLQVTGALPGAAGLLVLGFDPAWIRRHAGVVPLYLDLQQPLTTALMATGASGIWSGPLAVPNVPSLIGTTLAVQNAVVSTATGIGFDASNGLLLTAGN